MLEVPRLLSLTIQASQRKSRCPAEFRKYNARYIRNK